jgi:predicted peroxiredoxin
MSESVNVVVVLMTGKQDRGARATLAFGWACTALAMGRAVAVYLTMDGTYWSLKGSTDKVQVEGFEPLQQYLEQFDELGGEILVCSPCSEYYCNFDRSAMESKMIPQAQVVGLSTVVGRIGPTTSVVTF